METDPPPGPQLGPMMMVPVTWIDRTPPRRLHCLAKVEGTLNAKVTPPGNDETEAVLTSVPGSPLMAGVSSLGSKVEFDHFTLPRNGGSAAERDPQRRGTPSNEPLSLPSLNVLLA